MTVEVRLFLHRGAFTLDVDFSLPSSGTTVICGPSGSGKTTLLRCVAGLERDAQGYVRIGKNIWQQGKCFLPVHRRAPGYVPQGGGLLPHLTVKGNLDYGLKRSNEGKAELAEELIAPLDIKPLLDKYPHQLSGGECQRAVIARTITLNPSVLLLDEPLTAIDRECKSKVLACLQPLPRKWGIPMIYVTHSLTEPLQIADYVLHLHDGRVVESGTLSDTFHLFASKSEAASTVEAVVNGHDTEYGLCHLAFAGSCLTTPSDPLPEGLKVRLQIDAWDIVVSRTKPWPSSALNVIPATVHEVRAGTITLRIENAFLHAAAENKALTTLRLKPGEIVYAQINRIRIVR